MTVAQVLNTIGIRAALEKYFKEESENSEDDEK